jgi:hypothetical protein
MALSSEQLLLILKVSPRTVREDYKMPRVRVLLLKLLKQRKLRIDYLDLFRNQRLTRERNIKTALKLLMLHQIVPSMIRLFT